MSKQALVDRIAQKFDSNAEAKRAVEAVCEGILDEVGAGNMVVLHGFGTFKKKLRAARSARNPRTGEPIAVKEKTVLQFDTKITF
jgi:DNA-binding protein HU-beta